MKKLSVIVVNYNVCYFLEQTIKSVLKSIKNIDAEILVVDNNSVDGSVEMVKAKFPEVTLIESDVNLGFSKGNNLAIDQAKGEYVLLLNPDTVVEEDTLEKCCSFMDEHQDCGGLGVKMVDGKGKFLPESKRGLPTPMVAFYKISGLAALFSKSKIFGRYHLGYIDENKTSEVEVLSGAFLMSRKAVLDQVGSLDEDYFMYGEDIDLSYKITKAGYKNYYYPDTRIIHYKGESTKRTSINYVFIFYRAMIIFAKKHFSSKNANIFAFLINIAIYLKASIDITRNAIRKSFLTIADASLVYTGMYFLSQYWEDNFKPVNTPFPREFMVLAVPAFIAFWLSSNHFSGGNDKPVRIGKIIRGILIGTILISAISNFFDDYRYSKALIILGGALTIFVLILNRFLAHIIAHKNLTLGVPREKRVLLVGAEMESNRVTNLLRNINANVTIIGFVTPGGEKVDADLYLGGLRNLDEIVEIYKIDEVIFCSKDIAANEIIELMVNFDRRVLDYKIVPYDSNYIIGSNSKNRPGDFYTIDIKLNIAEKASVRNKRLLDLTFSFFCLLFFPVTVWLVEKKGSYIRNIFKVLMGRQSWVGFAKTTHVHLPKIKRGILAPNMRLGAINPLDDRTVSKLDMLYAKDYTVSMDLEIIWRSFSKLGN